MNRVVDTVVLREEDNNLVGGMTVVSCWLGAPESGPEGEHQRENERAPFEADTLGQDQSTAANARGRNALYRYDNQGWHHETWGVLG